MLEKTTGGIVGAAPWSDTCNTSCCKLVPLYVQQQLGIVLQVFHAGTARDTDNNVVAVGGRVLGVSAIGKTVREAQQKAYTVTVGLSSRYARTCLSAL